MLRVVLSMSLGPFWRRSSPRRGIVFLTENNFLSRLEIPDEVITSSAVYNTTSHTPFSTHTEFRLLCYSIQNLCHLLLLLRLQHWYPDVLQVTESVCIACMRAPPGASAQ